MTQTDIDELRELSKDRAAFFERISDRPELALFLLDELQKAQTLRHHGLTEAQFITASAMLNRAFDGVEKGLEYISIAQKELIPRR